MNEREADIIYEMDKVKDEASTLRSLYLIFLSFIINYRTFDEWVIVMQITSFNVQKAPTAVNLVIHLQ